MKRLLFVMIFAFTFANASLTADFTWSPQKPTDLQNVHFYDASSGDIVAWLWYFGDGNASTERNPVHRYMDDGNYTVRLVVIDINGSVAIKEKIINVSNVPPVAIAGKNITSNSLAVEFNASLSYDLDGHIVKYVWEFGDGVYSYGEVLKHTYAKEGLYFVNLTVYDDDNAFDVDSIKALVDITPPVTNYSLERIKEWYVKMVNITLNATDNLAGVNATFYRIDDKWIKYNGSFGIDKEGINKIYFYSIDKAGNVEKEKNITIKIDKTPPVTNYSIEGKEGKNKWYASSIKIKLSSKDNLSGVNYTMYKINHGDWKKYEKAINLSSNGEHKIYFYSVDKAGNVEKEKNITIKIDAKKPSVEINLPEEGYIYIAGRRIMPTFFGKTYIIGKFEAVATANDTTSGIDYVEFVLNNEILWRDYVKPYETYLPQEIPFSKNVLKVVAYDKAGNNAESKEIEYIKII